MNINFAILTISDRCSKGEMLDESGPQIASTVKDQGWQVKATELVPDDYQAIVRVLSSWCNLGDVDIVLTTGGTGLAPRDVTPEATSQVIERSAPGLAEAMRHASSQVTPHGMLSRGIAGIRGRTLIINLPGSPKAAIENLQTIISALPHAATILRGINNIDAGHDYKLL
jgi:molybdopterin adenylyltransferase